MSRGFAPDALLGKPVLGTTKGTIAHLKVPPHSVVRFGEPERARHILFPHYQAGAATTLSPVPEGQLFMRVAENAFNYFLLGPPASTVWPTWSTIAIAMSSATASLTKPSPC